MVDFAGLDPLTSSFFAPVAEQGPFTPSELGGLFAINGIGPPAAPPITPPGGGSTFGADFGLSPTSFLGGAGGAGAEAGGLGLASALRGLTAPKAPPKPIVSGGLRGAATPPTPNIPTGPGAGVTLAQALAGIGANDPTLGALLAGGLF